ncbi:flippase [Halorubrum sp. Atlit-8R]|uniref:flippase n=1 Tax=unclassified Halorubrum TaxID=2642239 RepID=UPI000EF19299|nr:MULTISPECIES: flippase [unclassified Halorubrum]RLM71386.1 flippase [Halorubrum sp. Atlit-9R]RLM82461.1 flippase [Halorubrum sp. Atlit-8R]
MPDQSKQLLQSGVLLLFSQVFSLGTLFLIKLVLARELGQSAFGVVSIGISMFTLISTIILFGQNTGVGRYIPRLSSDKQIRDYVISAFVTVIPASVTCSIAIILFRQEISSAFFDTSQVVPILIFAMVIPLAALMKLTVGVIQGLQNAQAKAIIQDVSLPVFLSVLGIFAAFQWKTAEAVSYAYLISYVLIAVVCLYFIYSRTSTFDLTGYKFRGKELLRFSAPLTITLIMFQILTHMDIFVIGYYHPSELVGIYSAVYPITKLLIFVLGAFRFLFMPIFSEFHSEGNTKRMRETYNEMTEWIVLLTLPIFITLILFPETIISVLYGPAYTDGANVLILLCIGFFTHTVLGPNRNATTAIGDTDYISKVAVIIATINIVLNILLIPEYQLVGAATATVVSYVIWNVSLNYRLYTRYSIFPIKMRLIKCTLISTGSIPILFLGIKGIGGIVGVVTFSLAFGIVHLISIYINDKEKVETVSNTLAERIS